MSFPGRKTRIFILLLFILRLFFFRVLLATPGIALVVELTPAIADSPDVDVFTLCDGRRRRLVDFSARTGIGEAAVLSSARPESRVGRGGSRRKFASSGLFPGGSDDDDAARSRRFVGVVVDDENGSGLDG